MTSPSPPRGGQAASSRTKRIVRWTYRQSLRGFALIGLTVVLFPICFEYTRIVSESMQPTLCGTNWENGDRVLTEKVSYWFRKPRQWDVICYRRDDGIFIMKRVIGLPGDKISSDSDGRILVNGEPLQVPDSLSFLDYVPVALIHSTRPPYDCGDGYFVLGDYTRDSDDSRYNGAVSPERIIGRPWLILGPSGRRGFVR